MKLNFLDCWRRRKDLPAFESGELPPERAEALAAHLAICDRCRSEWESLAGVAEALRVTPPEPVIPALNLWSRIEAEILEPAPVPAPAPVSRWKVAAVPAGAVLAAAGVFAATGGLNSLVSKKALQPETVSATPAALQAAGPAAPTVATIADTIVATPEPTPEPIDVDPTPAPKPKALRVKPKRTIANPRKDPFAPADRILAAKPRRDYYSTEGDTKEEPESIPITVTPPFIESDVNVTSGKGEDLDETIRVARPAPARSARRDAAAEAEAAERRAADALGSPIDAVARASQPRRLFP